MIFTDDYDDVISVEERTEAYYMTVRKYYSWLERFFGSPKTSDEVYMIPFSGKEPCYYCGLGLEQCDEKESARLRNLATCFRANRALRECPESFRI